MQWSTAAPAMVLTSFVCRIPASAPVPRLNMKTVFPSYGDSYVNDKTVGETVLSLTWEPLYW